MRIACVRPLNLYTFSLRALPLYIYAAVANTTVYSWYWFRSRPTTCIAERHLQQGRFRTRTTFTADGFCCTHQRTAACPATTPQDTTHWRSWCSGCISSSKRSLLATVQKGYWEGGGQAGKQPDLLTSAVLSLKLEDPLYLCSRWRSVSSKGTRGAKSRRGASVVLKVS